jgi:integrase
MWETGGRISDILNLKWADINFNKKLINMFVEKRDIFLNIPVSDMITSDLKNQFVFEKPKPADFLFPSHSKYGRLTRHGAR